MLYGDGFLSVYRIVNALRRPFQFAFDDLAVGFEFRRSAERNAYHLSRPAAFDLVFQRGLGKTTRLVLGDDQRCDKQRCAQDQKRNQCLFHGSLTIKEKNYPSACSTSARVGNEACAPIRVIAIEAATLANAIAASNVLPSASAVANAPLKPSRASVVSLASTWLAGKWRARSPSARIAPCAPSFRITCCGPRASNSRATSYASANAMWSPAAPTNARASLSFGVRMLTLFNNSAGNSRAGAGSRITVIPKLRACAAAAVTVASGVSSCNNKCEPPSAVKASVTSAGRRQSFAPGTTTI